MNNKTTERIIPTPTKEQLRERLTYSFVEGAFYWKHYPKLKPAGCRNASRRYYYIKFDQVIYLRHRLTWAYFYGDPGAFIVDHINKISDDDRIENLRLGNSVQNNCNTKMRCTNTSGFKGVTAHGKKWRTYIGWQKQKIYLGTYLTKEEAAAAYAEASNRLHGEFAGHLQ
jgi:hypothetical protein